jgi:Rod binding domain-containing protein
VAAPIDDAHKAARSLESYFLRRVLAEVKTSENSLTGGGFAGDTFKDMFDEAIADSMANAGGVGMADIIAKQMDPHPHKNAAEKTAEVDIRSDAKSAPVGLPRPTDLGAHRVAPLVTDPLGNRAVPAPAPAQPTETTAAPASTTGAVSLRRYRAAQDSDPTPSSSPGAGRPTDRR